MHLALPPLAFCISGGSQIGLQKPCVDSRGFFPLVIRLAPQAVASVALVEFSMVALSRAMRAAGRCGAAVARTKLRINLK